MHHQAAAQISDLEEKLQEAEDKCDEAQSKQTDLAIQLQKSRNEAQEFQNSMNDTIKENKETEIELADKIQELTDQLENKESSEALNTRKYTTEITNLNKTLDRYKEALQTTKDAKERLEYANSDLENKIKYGSFSSASQALKRKVEKLEDESADLKRDLDDKEEIIRGLKLANQRMTAQQNESRIYDAASRAEGSDPILLALKRQNAMLQTKLDVNEKQDQKEKESLKEQNRKLKAEMDLLQRRVKKESKVYEEKMTEIMNDSFSYSASVQSMSAIQSARMSMNEDAIPFAKQSRQLEDFQNQIHDLTQQYNSLQSKVASTESKYIESRLAATTAETEVEVLKQKREQDQDQIRKIMTDKTKLEAEFYRINDKLGEALNSINELEETNRKLQIQIAGNSGKKNRSAIFSFGRKRN